VGLFSGKPETKSSPDVVGSPPDRRPAATPQPAGNLPTVIGKDAVVKGELSSQTDMLIEGRVEGKIHGKHRVVIGESGNVNAQVHADVVSVRGEVHGDCEATNKVEIAATGKVFGNISAEAIVVAEGATFRGASKMTKRPQPKPMTAKPAPSKPQTNDSSSATPGIN
jgi:cytoskeletal protein CcmA (bactofilin family)